MSKHDIQRNGTGRMAELMEMVKAEHELCVSETVNAKRQRDEFEVKLEAQLGEMKVIKNALIELETRHVSLVQQYQDEIRLLRAELEKRGGVPPALDRAIEGDREQSAAKRARLGESNFSSIPVLAGIMNAKITGTAPGGEQQLGSSVTLPPKPAVGQNGTGADKPSLVALPPAAWSLSTTLDKPQVILDLKQQLSHDSAVCAIRFSNSGTMLATGCKKSAYVFSVETGERIRVFTIENDCYIRSVCFSPDDSQLVTGAEDELVRIFEVASQRLLRSLAGHSMEIFSVEWTSNGQYILSGSGDKSIRVWDSEAGTCIFDMVKPDNFEGTTQTGITCVAISPDNQMAAAGSLDRSICFWGIEKGNFLGQFDGTTGHSDAVYAVAFSPDGEYLASGSLDESLRLWDLSSLTASRCKSVFKGHKGWVLSVAFTPEGKWLLSGSKDLTIRFWDYRNPSATEPIAVLNRPKEWNSVIGMSVSPKGMLFATGSGDFKGRIWEYQDAKSRQESRHESNPRLCE